MQSKLALHKRSQRGMIAVWVALAMTMITIMAAYSVDMSQMYRVRTEMQHAADTAALAGGYSKQHGDTDAVARQAAIDMATTNLTADKIPNPMISPSTQWGGHSAWYHVTVTATVPLLFARIIGKPTATISAQATSYYQSFLQIPQNGSTFGRSNGPYTYSIFGPNALHSNGDPYAATKLNGGAANPEYAQNGYDYTVNVPSDRQLHYYPVGTTLATVNPVDQKSTKLEVDIFDPDCWNADGQIGPTVTPLDLDEIRAPQSSGGGNASSDATTTVFTLYWDAGTPGDKSDDVNVASATYGGNGASTDLKWVTPSGFSGIEIGSGKYSVGNFRVNVQSTAGSSENGFLIRSSATNPTSNDYSSNSTSTEDAWQSTLGHNPPNLTTHKGSDAASNGTSVSASEHLTNNFEDDTLTPADILLGNVPVAQGGVTQVINIKRFDCDIGSTKTGILSVYYTCDTILDSSQPDGKKHFPGTSANPPSNDNDQWRIDTIVLDAAACNGATYTGGNWHAFYQAGKSDTSNWTITYIGTGPGNLFLIGSNVNTPY